MHFRQKKCWHESLTKFEPNCFRDKLLQWMKLCECKSDSQYDAFNSSHEILCEAINFTQAYWLLLTHSSKRERRNMDVTE